MACGPSYECVDYDTDLWCAEKKTKGRYICNSPLYHPNGDKTKCYCSFEKRLALSNVPVSEEEM